MVAGPEGADLILAAVPGAGTDLLRIRPGQAALFFRALQVLRGSKPALDRPAGTLGHDLVELAGLDLHGPAFADAAGTVGLQGRSQLIHIG